MHGDEKKTKRIPGQVENCNDLSLCFFLFDRDCTCKKKCRVGQGGMRVISERDRIVLKTKKNDNRLSHFFPAQKIANSIHIICDSSACINLRLLINLIF